MTPEIFKALLAGGAFALIAFFAIRGLVRLAKAWRDLKEKVKWLEYAEKRYDARLETATGRSWKLERRVAELENNAAVTKC